jgi:hypothetical protein
MNVPTYACDVGVIVRISWLADVVQTNIELIVDSTYKAGIVVFVIVLVVAPHKELGYEPVTLSYQKFYDVITELPIVTVVAGQGVPIIVAVRHGSTTVIKKVWVDVTEL